MDKKIAYNDDTKVYYVKNESRLMRFYKNYSQLIYIIAIPLISSILPIVLQNKESCCAFVLIVMAAYWITECLPYAIVSLLPIPLFPLFDIMPSKEVSKIYFSDILMLFFGGLIVAICVESSGLHKKIAFKVIMFFGSNPIWLLLGVMSITGFLSLWISNVASASMMLPIIMAMVIQLAELDKTFAEERPKTQNIPINSQFALTQEMDSLDDITRDEEMGNELVLKGQLPNTKAAKNLMKCFLLSLTYAASIGGSGSLVGTAPNLILKGYYDEYFPNDGLNFFTFMIYSCPAAFLLIFLTWITLVLYWLPKKCILSLFKKKQPGKVDKLGEFVKMEYERLGPLTWEQGSVGGLFLILVVLWITRDLFFAPGWGDLFSKGYPTDVTPVIAMVVFLTAWPKENVFKGRPYQHLITWKEINDKFAWNVILLSGGGLALAAGFDKSNLSADVGEFLATIMPPQKELSLLLLLIFSFTFTEFTSNTSMASILIPITSSLAEKNNIAASYLLLPLTVSTSYSFMLPIATPTNAIVFGTEHLTIMDMIISGGFLKITGLIVLFLSTLWRPLIIPDQIVHAALNSTLSV